MAHQAADIASYKLLFCRRVLIYSHDSAHTVSRRPAFVMGCKDARQQVDCHASVFKTITELIKAYGLDVERFIRECLKEKPEDRPSAIGLLSLPLLRKLTDIPHRSLLLPPVAPLSMV